MSSIDNLLGMLENEDEGAGEDKGAGYNELIKAFPLESIQTHEKHQLALKVIGRLISYVNEENVSDTGIQSYFKELAKLISIYEDEHISK